MEIPQVVGPHVNRFCDDRIFEHEVRTIFNDIRAIFDTPLYSWSTLLLPTLVQWPVPLSGTELNLGSLAFADQLSEDLSASNANSGM
jgi:hypothetical protein